VASADTNHHGEHQEHCAGHGGTDGDNTHSQDGRRRARDRQASGARRPSVLLAERVVHASPPPSKQLEPITPRSSYHERTGSQR
jgi:hypothetical protein